MIKELAPEQWPHLSPFIHTDNARNYFIRLGLEGKRPIFSRIFVETAPDSTLKAALFERISGNLQFYAPNVENIDIAGFSDLLEQLTFKEFIAPASLGDVFLSRGCFSTIKEGAIIAELQPQKPLSSTLEHLVQTKSYDFEELHVKDLPDVVGLYLKVFHSFSPLPLMEEKLMAHRGRGLLLRNEGHLLALAQSEFENANSAVIVGVATDPEFQGQGFGSACVKALCTELLLEGKTLSLQYDNPLAGRLYEKLGFKPVDRMRHYLK